MNGTLSLALAFPLLIAPCASSAAEPRKVIVCTVTTGFRHSSIGEAEMTLQKLADETKAFTIVEFVRQPDVQVPKKPARPGEPEPGADETAKTKYAKDLKKYEEEVAKWTPEKEADFQKAQETFDARLKAEMEKLAPENLKKVDGVIFASTTGDNYPLPDREGFVKWVHEGGAFIGMHAASDTLQSFEPYYEMLQGTFNGHGEQVPAVLINADKSK